MDGERNLTRGSGSDIPVAKVNAVSSRPKDEELKPVSKGHRQKSSIGKQIVGEFIRNDFKDILKFGVMEVAIPGVKDVMYDWGTRILEMWLYRDSDGAGRGYRGGSNGGPRNYTSHFKGGKVSNGAFGNAMNRPVSNRDRVAQSFDSVEFMDRREAVQVYNDLLERLYEYGVVTVAQFYQLASCQYEYTDRDWGWTDLPGRIEPRRIQGGKWVLNLPKPSYLK